MVVVRVAPPIANPGLFANRFVGRGCWVTAAGVDAVNVDVRAGIGRAIVAGARTAVTPVKTAGRDVEGHITSPVNDVSDGASGAAVVLSVPTAKAVAKGYCCYNDDAAAPKHSPNMSGTRHSGNVSPPKASAGRR